MTKEELRIEAMTEILDDLEISIPSEKIKEITKSFVNHMEMEAEISNYQHSGVHAECEECKILKSKLERVTAERDVYHNNVCKRRNTNDVWIEGDVVMFKP